MRIMHIQFDFSDDMEMLRIFRDLAHQYRTKTSEQGARTAAKLERYLASEIKRLEITQRIRDLAAEPKL